MPSGDHELLQRLRVMFRAEAQEHVESIASGLIALERAAPRLDEGVLEAVFRAAHSLKGAARAVNVSSIESLCQALETAFSALRRAAAVPSRPLFDLLQRAVDLLSGTLATLDDRAAESTGAAIAKLTRAIQGAVLPNARPDVPIAVAPPDPPPEPDPAERPGAARSEHVRVRKRLLEKVLLRSEELLYAKTAAAERADELRALRRRVASWSERWVRLRADLRAMEAAMSGAARGSGSAAPSWARVRAYLEASHDLTAALESDLTRHARQANHDQRLIGTMVDQLLDDMKHVVVQPFSVLLELFPRTVRELSRDRGKEIDLSIEGGEIEIDRRILDEIKDPLIQLVRNAVDHGIERPQRRREVGKPALGRLQIVVSQRAGDRVELVVRDDGAGMDVPGLRHAAEKAGLRDCAGEAAAPDDRRAFALAFEAGVSTSPLITDLSGRGMGLAIVKHQVERLTGSIEVESLTGQGTTFRILLPLTLARFRGVVVNVGRRIFVIPTRRMERVARVPRDQIRTVEGRETVAIDGRALAMVRLGALLGVEEGSEARERRGVPVAVLGAAGTGSPIAFAVDEVIEEREVLVKPLGQQLERVRFVTGATVLGAGRVVPVLNISDLMKAAMCEPAAGLSLKAAAAGEEPSRKTILVAEDSITSRSLLRGILEMAGYRVETAADGVEAYAALRSGAFDLVVSDVDMPRLNGFGLTAKIRADDKLSELPVILVTALESREDREHGIDVGANAYIAKSRFDQANLLEVIRRLA